MSSTPFLGPFLVQPPGTGPRSASDTPNFVYLPFSEQYWAVIKTTRGRWSWPTFESCGRCKTFGERPACFLTSRVRLRPGRRVESPLVPSTRKTVCWHCQGGSHADGAARICERYYACYRSAQAPLADELGRPEPSYERRERYSFERAMSTFLPDF
jgi:hypothetical protein